MVRYGSNQSVLKYIFLFLCALGGISLFPSRANALCTTCTMYENYIKNEFTQHQNWMTNQWWEQNFEPGLKKIADEARNAIVFEVAAIGAFLDAQNENAAQRALQEMSSNTLKNYTASDTICKFGTLSRSLALSQSKSKLNQLALAKRSQGRQLGQTNMASSQGEDADRLARLIQFRKDYCDPNDFGTGMKNLCTSGGGKDSRQNIDIDFTRAVDTKNSLNIDFSDNTFTEDETDIMALANNLYAHRVFDRITDLSNDGNIDRKTAFLDQRSIVAKRSVAENSFYNMVGQKSKGGDASKNFLVAVIKNLGLSDADAQKYVGNNPSYDAQMEVLTKKLYQDPAFYANLMDSPANVNRQYAALQAFGLMQRRDIFETITRSEMLMSLLLEMEIAKYQDNIQNRSN